LFNVIVGSRLGNALWNQIPELAPLLHDVQTEVGGVASPFDSWLALRGMRTLHVRVERQCRSAMVVAEYLNQHPSVTAVHYPGLASHPLHSVAARQMQNGWFGCILSLELESEATAMAVAGALRTIQRATSLGGTETLIEHRASIEPPSRRTSPPGLLRMSVGLEDPADLLEDLENALAIAKKIVS
jgi:cystathionine gamma-synthase